jgi:lipopolysaccharide transport system ATP-binding protein
MSQIAIRAEALGKEYRLGVDGGGAFRYKSLRDTIASRVTAPFRRVQGWIRGSGGRSHTDSKIWALKDIDLEIQQGEVMGIVGRNGAGKSTLLKVLARITEPTQGRAEICGRVGSLLEVGTGFHSELTGRENIYLNGAILGMRRAEIRAKFDEIVAFSEVDRFIDTPVKHYSSGMYLRLAFAVAAHLEPEILFIDEVLAVGDAAFQKKCIGKLGSVARDGRTVLFVSHNLGALANLCTRAIFLSGGLKRSEGPVGKIIGEYINENGSGTGERVWAPADPVADQTVRLAAVRVFCNGQITGDVDIDRDIDIQIEFDNLKHGAPLSCSIHLNDQLGNVVLSSANFHSANLVRDEWFGKPHPAGRFRVTCTLPGNFLNEGTYSINVVLLSNVARMEIFEKDAISFSVHDTGAMRKEWGGEWIGSVRPRLAWRTTYLE